jgi:tetratricopeptide (TPR) repeat protein
MVTVVLAQAGCQTGVPEEKARAKVKWDIARSRVLAGCAEEQLAMGDLDKAHQQATEALALAPRNADARVVLGKVNIERGRYSSAVYELEKALESDPRSAKAAYMLGVAYEKSANLAEAYNCYQRAARLDSGFFAAVIAAAEVQAGMGNLQDALELLEGRLDQAGDDPTAYEVCGRLALMLDDPAKAESYYRTAHVLDDDNLVYIRSLAETHYRMGHHREALRYLNKLTGHGEYEATYLVYAMQAECYLALGEGKRARDAYYTSTELNPSDATLWLGLAKSYLMTDETGRAVLAARQARQLGEDSADAAMVLGWALLKEGRRGEAVAALIHAVSEHPESVMLRCLLGRAYAAGGNTAQAARCFNAALQLDPDSAVARSLLEALRNNQLSRAE